VKENSVINLVRGFSLLHLQQLGNRVANWKFRTYQWIEDGIYRNV